MKENGYAPLSDDEQERQSRSDRRYEDESIRFRNGAEIIIQDQDQDQEVMVQIEGMEMKIKVLQKSA